MKIQDIKNLQGGYLCLLVSAGDKNAPDPKFVNFNDGSIRSFRKNDDEGAFVTSHILIKSGQNAGGGHLMLIEKVPGINSSQINRYLRFLFRDYSNLKTFDDNGNNKEYRPLFEIVGYQSDTLRDAIVKNTLQDIEFVKFEEQNDGIDEYGYVQQKISRAKFVIQRGIETNTADPFFQKMMNSYRLGNYKEMYVRIKTRNKQFKTIEVDTEREDILEQYFIYNEIVRDFSEPLEIACETIRPDMVQKMLNTAKRFED